MLRYTTAVTSLLAALAALTMGAAAAPASARDGPPADRLPSVFDLTVIRSDDPSLLLATRGGLYRMGRDGRTERASDPEHAVWSVDASARMPRLVYASGELDGGGPGLFVSRTSGRAWDRLPAPGEGGARPKVVAVSDIEEATLFAADQRVWRSRDGGRSWAAMGSLDEPVIEIAASTTDVDTVYAATRGGLALSRDGGRTWRVRDRLTCGQPVTALDTGPGGFVYAFSLCRGLLRGDEKTGAWTVANRDFRGCIVQHIAVDPTNAARLFVAVRCQRILVSSDHGVTWAEVGSDQPWIARCATDATGGWPRPVMPDPEASAASAGRTVRRDGPRPRTLAAA